MQLKLEPEESILNETFVCIHYIQFSLIHWNPTPEHVSDRATHQPKHVFKSTSQFQPAVEILQRSEQRF